MHTCSNQAHSIPGFEIMKTQVTLIRRTYFFRPIIPQNNHLINPLLRNVVKWSDTLKQSCSICCKIFKSCLVLLRHCEVKD